MPLRFLIPLALLAAAAALWTPWSRQREALDRAADAQSTLHSALEAERNLTELRARTPMGEGSVADDVALLVQAAARDAGLRAQAVAEVSPQESILLPGAATPSSAPHQPPGVAIEPVRWKRHAVFIRLAALPLPDAGAFLHQLRAHAPAWTAAHVDLRAEPRRAAVPPPPSADAQADAVTTPPETALYILTLRLTRTHLDASSTPTSRLLRERP